MEKIKERKIDLCKLGFEANEHQKCFSLSKYNSTWYIDFWKISEYTDHKWNIFIEDIKYDLKTIKNQYYDDLKQHPAYNFAQKEFKKKLKDKFNHLNSNLQQLNNFKMDKTVNQEARIRLESQVKLLKELMNDK